MTRWLSPIFYGKFVHHILHLIVSHYCNAIRHRFHSTTNTRTDRDENNSSNNQQQQHLFMNEYKIAELILIDKAVLTTFFDIYDDDIRTGLSLPLKQQLDTITKDSSKNKNNNNPTTITATAANIISPHVTELLSLQYLSQIFMVSADGNELSNVGTEIKYLFDRYHLDGVRILQCIIHCQSNLNKQERKATDEFIISSFMKCASLSFSTTNNTVSNNTSSLSLPTSSSAISTSISSTNAYKLTLSEEYAYIGDNVIDLVAILGATNAMKLQQEYVKYKKSLQ